jgi:hypothetical protein
MKKEEREALVAECRASGMTAREWCRLKGIKYTRYCSWATRVNRETRQVEQQQWAYVTVTKEDCSNNGIKLHYGNLIISVEPGFNPTLLADILKVVHALC